MMIRFFSRCLRQIPFFQNRRRQPAVDPSPCPTYRVQRRFNLILLCMGWGALGFSALIGWSACHSKTISPPLVIGMDLSHPPFETVDASGKPAGLSVALAEALGQALHQPIRIENIPFVGLIPALNSGKIDLIVSSLAITEERKQAVDFSDPYFYSGLSLLVKKTSPIQGIADADQPGKHIAVLSGTTSQIYALHHLQKAKFIAFPTESAAVLEVIQGKADAFLFDQISIWEHWKQYPQETRPLLERITKEGFAIGIKKGNLKLQNKVNAFIQQFWKDQGPQKLVDRYLPEQKAAFQAQGVPLDPSNGETEKTEVK